MILKKVQATQALSGNVITLPTMNQTVPVVVDCHSPSPGRNSLHSSTSKVIITMDTSHWGWRNLSVGGRWELGLEKEYISFLKLLAIKYALLSLQCSIWGHHVSVLMDNTTDMAYINYQGGTVPRKLCTLVKKCGKWLCHWECTSQPPMFWGPLMTEWTS